MAGQDERYGCPRPMQGYRAYRPSRPRHPYHQQPQPPSYFGHHQSSRETSFNFAPFTSGILRPPHPVHHQADWGWGHEWEAPEPAVPQWSYQQIPLSEAYSFDRYDYRPTRFSGPRFPAGPQTTVESANMVPNPLNKGRRPSGSGCQSTYTRSTTASGKALVMQTKVDEEMTFGDLLMEVTPTTPATPQFKATSNPEEAAATSEIQQTQPTNSSNSTSMTGTPSTPVVETFQTSSPKSSNSTAVNGKVPIPPRGQVVRFVGTLPGPLTKSSSSTPVIGKLPTAPRAPVVVRFLKTLQTTSAKSSSSTPEIGKVPTLPRAPVVRFSETFAIPAAKSSNSQSVTGKPPTPPRAPIVRISEIPTPSEKSSAAVAGKLPTPPRAPVVRLSKTVEIPATKSSNSPAVTGKPPTPPRAPIVRISEIPIPWEKSDNSTAVTGQAPTPPRAPVLRIPEIPLPSARSSDSGAISSRHSPGPTTGFQEVVAGLFHLNPIQPPSNPSRRPEPIVDVAAIPLPLPPPPPQEECEVSNQISIRPLPPPSVSSKPEVLGDAAETPLPPIEEKIRGTSQLSPSSSSSDCQIVLKSREQNTKSYAVEVLKGLKKKGFQSVGIKFPPPSVIEDTPSFKLYLEEFKCPLIFVVSAQHVAEQTVTVHVIKGYEPDSEDDDNVFEHLKLSSAFKLARAKLVRVKYTEFDKLASEFLEAETLKRLIASEFLTDADYHHLMGLVQTRWMVQRVLQNKTKYDLETGIPSLGQLQRRVLKVLCLPPPSTTSSIVTTVCQDDHSEENGSNETVLLERVDEGC